MQSPQANPFHSSRAAIIGRVHRLLPVIVGVLLLPTAASAHEDLLLRISMLTERLRTNGPSAEVTFQRAEIYRLHQDWELALRDYAAAKSGWTNRADLELGRALTLAGWGRLAEARPVFDAVVGTDPTNSVALLERARILAKLHEPVLALADYSRAIINADHPRAGDYLERAPLQAAVAGPAAALKGLDEGLARLGWTLTLQSLAVDYEVACGNFDAALARWDTIDARSSRHENWLARKGEILRQAGRVDESRRAFESALAAINKLPPRLAAAEKIAALRVKIETALTALKPSANSRAD